DVAYRDATARPGHKADCRCIGIPSGNRGAGAQTETIVTTHQRLFIRANRKRCNVMRGIVSLPIGEGTGGPHGAPFGRRRKGGISSEASAGLATSCPTFDS